jgi:hypothetical protein
VGKSNFLIIIDFQVFYLILKKDPISPFPYFILFFLVGRVILLSLFLTIMLNNYDEAKAEATRARHVAENIISQL